MVTYKFNSETNILETTFTGQVEVSDISEYIISISEDDSLPKGLRIYTNAKRARFMPSVSPSQLSKLVKANKVSLSKRDFIYDCFVVSGSIEMALGQMYREISRTKKYKFNIVSTEESALEWLINLPDLE